MKLFELFSPIGGPKEEMPEIDWLGDLKAYIDDNESLITRKLMPAIQKHKKYQGHPNAYKIYIKPLNRCAEDYCSTFDIDDIGSIFPPDKIIELAKVYSEQQENFIKRGDYED
jgi:hypothetical protein